MKLWLHTEMEYPVAKLSQQDLNCLRRAHRIVMAVRNHIDADGENDTDLSGAEHSIDAILRRHARSGYLGDN